MMHTNYQPAKAGVYDNQIRHARSVRIHANVDPRGRCYNPEMLPEHTQWGNARLAMLHQRMRLRYSDQGDFTRCYRGGF